MKHEDAAEVFDAAQEFRRQTSLKPPLTRVDLIGIASDLATQLADLRRELAAIRDVHAREVAALKGSLAAIRASTSWRLTQPLRSTVMWLRGERPQTKDGGRPPE